MSRPGSLDGSGVTTHPTGTRWAASLPAAVLLAATLVATSAASRDFTPEECPVIANAESRIYHVPKGLNYRMMLRQNKRKTTDNRVCFPSEEAARGAGYRKAHN